jgi:hypothetical protein
MSREMQPTRPPSMRELRDELQVAINARRELPAEMEDALVTNFLQQIERAIDLRVDARVAEVTKYQKKSSAAAVGTVAASLALSIPLFGIATSFGPVGGPIAAGIIAVMVLIINILAFLKR